MPALLAVTLGDPCGIGPEITAKALARLSPAILRRLIIVGSLKSLREAFHQANRSIPEFCPHDKPRKGAIQTVDPGITGPFFPGKICKKGGEAAIAAIEAAHELCDRGVCGGMATGPIGKKAIQLAGSPFSGHTDMLCRLAGAKSTRMAMVYGDFRVVMTTLHISYAAVLIALTVDAVYETLRLAHAAFASPRKPLPSIAVAGLNPHAGEGELFGPEEETILKPAMKRFSRVNPNLFGPFPCDSLFKKETRARYDAIVAQTHDQGLIAIKTIGGIKCVNVTLGLPYVRTSVGHGTAYDIAGKKVADESGMIAAIREGIRLTEERNRKTGRTE